MSSAQAKYFVARSILLISAALTGLEMYFERLTQGVALGYYLPGFQPFESASIRSPNLEPLLLPARDFLDALGHGQILRHRAAEFVNGLADYQNQIGQPLEL